MAVVCNSSGTHRLLQRLSPELDPQALGELFARHQERLRKIVRFRLDGRLRGKITSSAVLLQVYGDVLGHIGEYLTDSSLSFFLWLRGLTGKRIQELHRQHLGACVEDAAQDICLHSGALPEVTAASMAAQFLGDRSANQADGRADQLLKLQSALNSMDALDREILALRNFEELSMDEARTVLDLDKTTATLRYVQAAKRFNEILRSIPGIIHPN